jgi:hypothetical protein
MIFSVALKENLTKETMKKLTISMCALAAMTCVAFGGTETYSSGKEMKQQAAIRTTSEWYRDTEWNISLWGTYAFTGEEWENDTYLGVDHAWGGGLDAKYFFARYFGAGLEAYGLALNDQTGITFAGTEVDESDLDDRGAAGAVLGTFTFRYPIPNSRIAPYGFVGGGVIFGGGGREEIFFDTDDDVFRARRDDSEAKLISQFGGGFEVRLTPTIGIMNDFSWNVVDGGQNNFGMARAGVTFAF